MSGSSVPATRFASSGVYPPACSSAVREDGDETGIVRRLTREVGISLRADKEDSLRGQRAAVRLDPTPARAVQRAGPQANPFGPKGRVGHFQHDAAHVFVGEEIVAGELQIVQGALRVEEEGIAAPAREEAVARRPPSRVHPDPSRQVLLRR